MTSYLAIETICIATVLTTFLLIATFSQLQLFNVNSTVLSNYCNYFLLLQLSKNCNFLVIAKFSQLQLFLIINLSHSLTKFSIFP